MNNRIGVMTSLTPGPSLSEVHAFGLAVCQLVSWERELWTPDRAAAMVREMADTGVRITAFWAGWPGPKVWDFREGPATLGIVPAEYRRERVETLKHAGEFAHAMGLPAVITHLGFIPENPGDPVYGQVVEAVSEVALHLQNTNTDFWFETGQETPTTMLRLIRDVGTPNLGVNLDPANLILYGKANPIDALDLLGPYVRNIHAKDGLYPTDPMELGKEVTVGTGRVRYPEFLHRLEEIGFTGEFIIEREITGPEQQRDIRDTVEYLDRHLAR